MITVRIPKSQVQKLILLAYQIAAAKQGSYWYRKDSHALVERYARGLCGEQAVEYYLKTPVVEWVADKKGHAYPDVKAYGVGVKTGRTDMPPLVEKLQSYPQIFCTIDEPFIDGTKDIEVIINGWAEPHVIMNNLDDSKIADWRVKRKGTKSAFVGFDQLHDMKDLQPYYQLSLADITALIYYDTVRRK